MVWMSKPTRIPTFQILSDLCVLCVFALNCFATFAGDGQPSVSTLCGRRTTVRLYALRETDGRPSLRDFA